MGRGIVKIKGGGERIGEGGKKGRKGRMGGGIVKIKGSEHTV